MICGTVVAFMGATGPRTPGWEERKPGDIPEQIGAQKICDNKTFLYLYFYSNGFLNMVKFIQGSHWG